MDVETARYEVRITGRGSEPVLLMVSAAGWVEAWQEGLSSIGVNDFPADAVCAVAEQQVQIRVPSLDLSFVIATVCRDSLPAESDASPLSPRTPPHRRTTPLGGLHSGRNPARLMAPGPAPTVRLDPALPTETAPERPAAITGRGERRVDPLDDLLALLERQRHLARPIALDSDTGLPAPRTPTANPLTPFRRGPEETTQPDALDFLRQDELPQQFLPIAFEGRDLGDAEGLRWVVETAQRQLPCELALLVAIEPPSTMRVVAMTGAHRTEALEEALPGWLGSIPRAPQRTRFSTPHVLFLSHPEAVTIEVDSILSAPIDGPSGELLMLVNSLRPQGFTDSEVRALRYLADTIASRRAR